RQWQDLFYQKNYYASLYTGNPDFVKLAEAYGIFAVRVTDKAQVASAIQDAMQYPGPALVDFMVDPEENVYPFIPPGESVKGMLEQTVPAEEAAWSR
ncbi:MAG: thiamine pyrophosphate-dependent enzyme, partial [Chloroflexota bacterium]